MESKKINRNFFYSPELKLEAVQRYLNGDSCRVICEQLNIQDPKRIYVWTKAFEEKGEFAFVDQRGKHSFGRPKKKFLTVQEEIEYLRAQNLLLKKSIARKRGC